jgi:hypothetical protein
VSNKIIGANAESVGWLVTAGTSQIKQQVSASGLKLRAERWSPR